MKIPGGIRYTAVYGENSERPLAVDWGGPRMRHA